jgi:hypothetical protein
MKTRRLIASCVAVLLLSGCGDISNLNCASTQIEPGSGGESQAALCGSEFGQWIRDTPWAIPAFIAGAIVVLIVFVTALVLLWRKAGRPRRAGES